MRINVGSHVRGGERTMTVILTGTDDDFVDLIDEGALVEGVLGNLAAQIAAQTGLVAEPVDDRATAARYMRRAVEVLERGAK